MIKELVFATNNAHKIEEAAYTVGSHFKILSLKDILCEDDIEETGTTFKENASIKTHHIYQKYNLDCFGDDSGLEIEALNGEPGVYSARYAGKHGNHDANITLVLNRLQGVNNRKARFKTVISLIWKVQNFPVARVLVMIRFFSRMVIWLLLQKCLCRKKTGSATAEKQ